MDYRYNIILRKKLTQHIYDFNKSYSYTSLINRILSKVKIWFQIILLPTYLRLNNCILRKIYWTYIQLKLTLRIVRH